MHNARSSTCRCTARARRACTRRVLLWLTRPCVCHALLLLLLLLLCLAQGTSAELELVAAQWEAVRASPERWSRPWCLAASAALGRVTLALSAFADDICGHVQVRAGCSVACGVVGLCVSASASRVLAQHPRAA